MKIIVDSGKAVVNDDVDKGAFADATMGVWKLYTNRFGDSTIKAIQAIR